MQSSHEAFLRSVVFALEQALPGQQDAPARWSWEAGSASGTNSSDSLNTRSGIALRFGGSTEGVLYLVPEEACSRALFPEIDPEAKESLAAAWSALGTRMAVHLSATLLRTEMSGEEASSPVRPTPLADLTLMGSEGPAGSLYLLSDPLLVRSLAAQESLSTAPAAWADSSTLLAAKPKAEALPIGRVIDVPLNVTLRFGQRQLTLREVLELNTGSLLELDQQVEEPVHLMLGDRVIARGEVVIVDGNYGMRVTDVVEHPAQRVHGVR